jgi:PDZ domain-containing secreted protein
MQKDRLGKMEESRLDRQYKNQPPIPEAEDILKGIKADPRLDLDSGYELENQRGSELEDQTRSGFTFSRGLIPNYAKGNISKKQKPNISSLLTTLGLDEKDSAFIKGSLNTFDLSYYASALSGKEGKENMNWVSDSIRGMIEKRENKSDKNYRNFEETPNFAEGKVPDMGAAAREKALRYFLQNEEGKKQLEKIVEGYTRESGVRGLEAKIAQVIRNAAKSIAMEEEYNKKVTDADIVKVLGVPRLERDKYENNDVAGVVTGLAWTSVGGDILFIESLISKGKGAMTITGNLGTVMKESATIALEYIKSNADIFGIDPELLSKYNVHLHVPEGATPKDGPSAGIAMLTSLVSLFTQKRVKKSLAMTGEITLRGKVLPVGGIKEKILAAKRANIKEIILCHENKSDIDEIKPEYLEGLTFHYVKEMSEVLKIALLDQKVKNAKVL